MVGIHAEKEGNNTLKKVQPNYTIPPLQTNTSLMSFRARGQKEHSHTDGWSEGEKRQSHGRPGWLPGNAPLPESRHETGSYVPCLVTVKPQGKIIPSWGIFVLNYCWWFVWGTGSRWYHPWSPDWKIKTSPFVTDLGFDSELGTGKYFRNLCIS